MEEWRDIEEFPGYQVSNEGRVRSFYKKQKKSGSWGGTERVLCEEPQRILGQSDDGNGYMKVFLQNGEKRRCVKVHRLVAEAFVDNPEGYDTVDHIKSGPDGKLDNTPDNLRWISRRDNIQKAYKDGMCDARIRRSKKPIMAYDDWTGDELYFSSIEEASNSLNVDRTSISHALKDERVLNKRYRVDYAGREDRLLYGSEHDYDEEFGYY